MTLPAHNWKKNTKEKKTRKIIKENKKITKVVYVCTDYIM